MNTTSIALSRNYFQSSFLYPNFQKGEARIKKFQTYKAHDFYFLNTCSSITKKEIKRRGSKQRYIHLKGEKSPSHNNEKGLKASNLSGYYYWLLSTIDSERSSGEHDKEYAISTSEWLCYTWMGICQIRNHIWGKLSISIYKIMSNLKIVRLWIQKILCKKGNKIMVSWSTLQLSHR